MSETKTQDKAMRNAVTRNSHEIKFDEHMRPLCPANCGSHLVQDTPGVYFCPNMRCSFDEDVLIASEGDETTIH